VGCPLNLPVVAGSVILAKLRGIKPMWDEIADMPGEIFDIEMSPEERAEFQQVCNMTEEEYYYYIQTS
jgi:hypothetical protein